jgi:hypothetical protein
MTYNEIKQECENKNISLGDLVLILEMTRAGFKGAIDNETLALCKLKLLCQKLDISPLRFFDNISESKSLSYNTNERLRFELDKKELELKLTKERLSDKDDIISMLREKLNFGIAATPKNTYKTK